MCNFSLVVLRISILSLDVSIDRCKENFPTNRVTRSLHVASNFAFCSVVNVFFLQPETILDIPYASLMAFYYIIKSTHLIQRITIRLYVEVKFSHILNIRVPRLTEKRVISGGFL